MTEEAHENAQLADGLYVINLGSSNKPMPLFVPFRHELVGFSVFRSRKFEDGHERFRLHLGYFDTQRHAEEALAVVRKYYPAAWISAAPGENLGSLEDTFSTEFRLVRAAYARVVRPEELPRPTEELPKPTEVSPPPPPVSAKVVASNIVRLPGSTQPLGSVQRKPVPQRYVVQLEWSVAPIVTADIPRLAIFDAYSLYTVREQREGLPQYGLRLGFFTNADSARQVAEYLRSEFPAAGVVPVSHREYIRALEAAKQRALRSVESGEQEQRPKPA